MKKSIALRLALVRSLCACGGGKDAPETSAEATTPEEVKRSKDEMPSAAIPLTKDERDKSICKLAFAKT